MYSVNTKEAPKIYGPVNQGASAARYLYISAQLPLCPENNKLIEGSVGTQAVQVIKNIEAILSAAGLTISDVCHVTLMVTDYNNLEAIDEVYAERFDKPYPARTVIEVSRLPEGAYLQMDAVALR